MERESLEYGKWECKYIKKRGSIAPHVSANLTCFLMPLGRSATDHVVCNEDHNGTDYGNEKTVEIEPRHLFPAENAKQPAAHDCADDPQNDVEEDPFPSPINDEAREKAREKP